MAGIYALINALHGKGKKQREQIGRGWFSNAVEGWNKAKPYVEKGLSFLRNGKHLSNFFRTVGWGDVGDFFDQQGYGKKSSAAQKQKALLQKLMAHAHDEQVGRGFWGDLWDGVKSVGSTIWNGAKAVGNFVKDNGLVSKVGSLIPGPVGTIVKGVGALTGSGQSGRGRVIGGLIQM